MRPVHGHVWALLTLLLLAGVLTACGNGDPAPPTAPEHADPQVPDDEQGFDPEASPAQARSFLGVSEDEVDAAIADTVMVRIMRRGDEQFAGTMDLRPGRLNLELDPDEDGTYRVSRVVIETEDGSDLVIE